MVDNELKLVEDDQNQSEVKTGSGGKSRRQFLQFTAALAVGEFLSGCIPTSGKETAPTQPSPELVDISSLGGTAEAEVMPSPNAPTEEVNRVNKIRDDFLNTNPEYLKKGYDLKLINITYKLPEDNAAEKFSFINIQNKIQDGRYEVQNYYISENSEGNFSFAQMVELGIPDDGRSSWAIVGRDGKVVPLFSYTDLEERYKGASPEAIKKILDDVQKEGGKEALERLYDFWFYPPEQNFQKPNQTAEVVYGYNIRNIAELVSPPPTEIPVKVASPTAEVSVATPVQSPTKENTPVPAATRTAAFNPTATFVPTSVATEIVPTPKPTATKIPELLWNGDNPAPLGFLKEIVLENYDRPYRDMLVSGILERIYKRELMFMGKKEQIWMISVYFGDTDNAEKIIGEFFLGRDYDKITRGEMMGRSLALDSNPASNTSGFFYSDEVKDIVEDLKVSKQYAFEMMVEPDFKRLENWSFDYRTNPATAPIIYAPYNTKILAKMKGEDVQIDDSEFGWQYYIYIPPDH